MCKYEHEKCIFLKCKYMGTYLNICKKVIGTKMKACFATIEKRISASANDSLLPGELEA